MSHNRSMASRRLGVSASALAFACGVVSTADAQWIGVPSGVVPGELCVIPKEAYQGWTIAEELRQEGYLILAIAPMSGMVLIAAPHPEIMAICRETIQYRADVKAVQYNTTGPVGARQPICTTDSDPSCPTDPTCCGSPWPDLQIVQPWPPTPAGTYPASGVPNDPYFFYQWGIANTGQTLVDRSYPHLGCQTRVGRIGVDMGVLDAWQRTTGSPSIAVAILDTGVEYCNPDLDPDRFIEDDIALVCPGNSGASYPCCSSGVCTYTSAGDHDGHGTMIAGIIGARANNDLGIAGVDQQCKILAATTVAYDSFTFANNMARTVIALEEIATLSKYDSVRVINMSTGLACDPPSGGGETLSDALRAVVALLHAQNRFIVSISHNGGVGSANIYCPNNFANVITVGGIDAQGWRFSYSNGFGSGTGTPLDFMAPGWAMLSTVCQTDACEIDHAPGPCPYASGPCGNYQQNFTSGTSWAAPMVAATISLLLARAEFLGINDNFAEITFAEMYEILRQSCVDTSGDPTRDPLDTPGWDEYYGHGLVNAHHAMLALERLHYKCRADRTANNSPGTSGYGIPDKQITPADLAYFQSRYPHGDIAACDVTSTGCVTLTASCGAPDGVVDQSDWDYFMLFYNTSLTNCASLPCNCP